MIKSVPRFKVLNPLLNFKQVFKKEVDQQWSIAGAMFLNLILQLVNIGCLLLTQSSLSLRMEFEENEYRRGLWGTLLHIGTWAFLCYLRRKHFAIPRLLGLLTFNILALSFLYLQSYALASNGFGDPNSKMIFSTFLVSDCFFGFLYVALNDYIYTSGYFGFCAFPKVFFAVSFYFYFDDRLMYIAQMFALTSFTSFFAGLVSEELLGDCFHENITEFGVLDFYTLMYLDIPYIAKKSVYGVYDMWTEFRERMFEKRNADKYDNIVEEEEEKKDGDKEKKE